MSKTYKSKDAKIIELLGTLVAVEIYLKNRDAKKARALITDVLDTHFGERKEALPHGQNL